MSERVDAIMRAIMGAAERRIRAHGDSGFSFREIAGDAGMKSASVHHHFPTKIDLAAAVLIEEDEGAGRIEAWRRVFRRSLRKDGLMCLCGILAVEGDALPEPVAAEARLFFERGVASIDASCEGGGADASPTKDGDRTPTGLRVLAQLEGAMLIARSMGRVALFDDATATLG